MKAGKNVGNVERPRIRRTCRPDLGTCATVAHQYLHCVPTPKEATTQGEQNNARLQVQGIYGTNTVYKTTSMNDGLYPDEKLRSALDLDREAPC